jgi:menaquinone-9 beta-reductase
MTGSCLASRGASVGDWDAIVIGAGPAGSLAARRLALAGASTLLVDKKSFPRSKVCGACLNQDALDVLCREGLGALVDQNGGTPLCAFRVGCGHRIAHFALPEGRALSRERFDSALVSEAIAAGAVFLPQTQACVEPCAREAGARVVRLDRPGESSAATARVVIVAAGLGHRALELVTEIKTHVAAKARIGAGCVLDASAADYAPGIIHMAVGRGGYVGIVRLDDNRLNVGAAFDRSFVRAAGTPGRAAALVLDEAGFPEIAAQRGPTKDPQQWIGPDSRLALRERMDFSHENCQKVLSRSERRQRTLRSQLDDGPWHGTVGLTQCTRPVAIHRLMLIGDATGYVEPFTGQGMACALASARAVAPLALRGIESWSPALEREWLARHRALFGRRLWLCRALAELARRPLAARAAFVLAARIPQLSRFLINQVSDRHAQIETSGACP